MLKLKCLTALSVFAIASAANASDYDDEAVYQSTKLNLGGYVHLKYAYVNQKPEFETNTPGSKTEDRRKSQSLFSQTQLTVNYMSQLNDDYAFGVDLTLYSDNSRAPNGSNNRGKAITSYLTSPYGKFELGEQAGASVAMQKGASTIAVGTGGIDGMFDFYENSLTIDGALKNTIFVNYPNLPIGSDFNTRRGKISYFSPNYNGWSYGASFTPDIENSGAISNNLNLSNTITPSFGSDLVAYKNIFEGAVNYTTQHSGVTYELAATTQIGSSKNVADSVNRKNLRAFELGGIASVDGFSFAASYGDWGDSGTTLQQQEGNKYGASYYTLGAAYNNSKYGASVTYLNSKRAGGSRVFEGSQGIETEVINEDRYNKLDVLSLGVEYKIAEGLKSYIEYTNFSYDRSDSEIDNKGGVYIFGAKLSF